MILECRARRRFNRSPFRLLGKAIALVRRAIGGFNESDGMDFVRHLIVPRQGNCLFLEPYLLADRLCSACSGLEQSRRIGNQYGLDCLLVDTVHAKGWHCVIKYACIAEAAARARQRLLIHVVSDHYTIRVAGPDKHYKSCHTHIVLGV